MSKCEWCDVEFAAVDSEQVYCKKSHKNQASRARKRYRARGYGLLKSPGDGCPTPHKISHDDFDNAFGRLVRLNRPGLEVYLCRCGKHHIGHIRADEAKKEADLMRAFQGAAS